MLPSWLSYIDVIFLLVVLLFAWGGSQRGYAAQVAPAISLVIMSGVMLFAYPAVYEYFRDEMVEFNAVFLMWISLAAVGVFGFVIYLLVDVLTVRLVTKEMSVRADHTNGFFLGLVRGAFVGIFVMTLIVMLGPVQIYEHFKGKSAVGGMICNEIAPRVLPEFRHIKFDLHKKVNLRINRRRIDLG